MLGETLTIGRLLYIAYRAIHLSCSVLKRLFMGQDGEGREDSESAALEAISMCLALRACYGGMHGDVDTPGPGIRNPRFRLIVWIRELRPRPCWSMFRAPRRLMEGAWNLLFGFQERCF